MLLAVRLQELLMLWSLCHTGRSAGIGKTYLPHIVIGKPRRVLCCVCQQYSMAVMNMANSKKKVQTVFHSKIISLVHSCLMMPRSIC